MNKAGAVGFDEPLSRYETWNASGCPEQLKKTDA